MTGRLVQLTRLLPALSMAFEAEQGKMAALSMQISQLNEQYAALDKPRSGGLESAATRVGADIRWAQWVERRKVAINKELARLKGDREQQRQAVALALSKREAAQHMLEKEKRAALNRQARRD